LSKGFISLEYILLFASLLLIFSVFLITINNLYQNNLSIIDLKNLNYTKTNIQDIISFQELQISSLNKIIVSPNDCWSVVKKNRQEIIIKNSQKEYSIFTTTNFITNNLEICFSQILIIEKKNNNIYLYLEQL
jgi:hypothetical protein